MKYSLEHFVRLDRFFLTLFIEDILLIRSVESIGQLCFFYNENTIRLMEAFEQLDEPM